jgi:3-methyl-2-oxobutanoate hydroxymethyltransferase
MSARPQSEQTSPEPRAMTVPRFVDAKKRGERLTVLTAYDSLLAGILDAAGVDAVLVGDSLGMVVQGRRNTLSVTLREMIYHAEIVARAVKRALVIVDMPFLSFQLGPRQAVRNAGLIIKRTGASCVKLEAGAHQAETIRALTEADIPVMAHVGLKPQSVLKMGGYKIQRDQERLLNDARAAEQAGAFAVVLECIPAGVARQVTQELSIPTIGIGAGPHCDGQVLVTQDMLGLTGSFRPRFVKPFANLRDLALAACRQYVEEVRGGCWPDDQHSHA